MKITISKSELATALDTVIKATASRTSVPTLAGVLLTTEQDSITLFATDLETSIKTKVNGLIEEGGSLAVPGKIFLNIIKSLPEAAVILEIKNDIVQITCNQAQFSIKTLNAADFSPFPNITGIQSVTLPTTVLSDMVRKVAKSVSHDDTRAVLTGIYVTIEKEIIKMVSTDGYRLSLVEKYLEEPVTDSFEALIPGKSFDEVMRMAGVNPTVSLTLTSNQILFEFGDTSFVTRRLNGNFPNYKQLISHDWSAKATIAYSDLYEAVKRVSILALNNTALKLSLNNEEQKLTLTALTQDVGEAQEDVEIKMEGKDQNISFRHTYIQDGLSVIDNDTITLQVTDPLKPGLLCSPEEGFTYLMLPVRTI